MASSVIDASTLLALVNNEPGADKAAGFIADAVISAVNLAEAISKLVERGATMSDARAAFALLPLEVADFTRPLAEMAGGLVATTRAHGLSLGDRACLALASRLALPAVTADRAWAELNLDVEVILIR